MSSGDGNFRLTASANFSSLQNEVERQRRSIQGLEAANKKLASGLGAVGKTHQSAFSGMLASGARMIVQYAGIHQAVSLVTRGLRDQIALEEQLRQATTSVAEAKQKVLPLFKDFTDEQVKDIFQFVGAKSVSLGISEAAGILTLDQIVSATAGKAEDRTRLIKETFGEVAPLFRVNTEELGVVSGSILDLQRAVGLNIAGTTNLALSFLSQTRLGTVADLPALIRTISATGAILQPTDKVQAAKDTAALFGAFGATFGEAGGKISGTSIGNFIAVLAEKLGKEAGGLSAGDVLKQVRTDPALVIEVFESVLGRSLSKPVQRRFLEEGSELSKLFEEMLTAFKDIDPEGLRTTQMRTANLDRDVRLATDEKIRAETALRDVRQGRGFTRAGLFGEKGELILRSELFQDQMFKSFEKFSFELSRATGVSARSAGMDVLVDAIQRSEPVGPEESVAGRELRNFLLMFRSREGRVQEMLSRNLQNEDAIAFQKQLKLLFEKQAAVLDSNKTTQQMTQRHIEVMQDSSAAVSSSPAGSRQEN